VTDSWPGELTVIVPAQVHMHVEVLSSAGISLIVTLSEPGDHGLAITGMHGCGVSTPSAALVAAATWGLAGDMHIPKVGMLAIEMSVTTPAGVPPCTVTPVAANVAGIAPIVQVSIPPVTTSKPTGTPSVARDEDYPALPRPELPR
jgi:hypothetical protein